VWGMTGPGPNQLAALCDETLAIDAPSTAAVQALHLVAVHAVCAAVDEHVTRLALQDAARTAEPAVLGVQA
jgi:D-sedoheptulose 7-phosphate isomerase